ncbi:MAG: hypothetical protein F6J93_00540 [Oscillatoria sp. SIO1A7]|nr:hypothetical protein [Oscillatoria sp. SIO1A7]
MSPSLLLPISPSLPTPHTLHPIPHTLHPTPYTLHPTPFANAQFPMPHAPITQYIYRRSL